MDSSNTPQPMAMELIKIILMEHNSLYEINTHNDDGNYALQYSDLTDLNPAVEGKAREVLKSINSYFSEPKDIYQTELKNFYYNVKENYKLDASSISHSSSPEPANIESLEGGIYFITMPKLFPDAKFQTVAIVGSYENIESTIRKTQNPKVDALDKISSYKEASRDLYVVLSTLSTKEMLNLPLEERLNQSVFDLQYAFVFKKLNN